MVEHFLPCRQRVQADSLIPAAGLSLAWDRYAGMANNGSLKLSIDGQVKQTLTGKDNDTRQVDSVRLGAALGIDSGTRGTLYLDEYRAWDPLQAVSAQFSYDGDGRRVKSVVNGATTAFVGTYLEWTGSTSTMKKYYYFGAQRVAVRDGNGTGETGLSWLLSDHLGSTTITLSAIGAKTAEKRYRPWGEERFSWGTLPTKYTYTGQYSNVEQFGLLFYNARWFDPWLGRFISADSLIPNAGLSLAWDRYAYANNNALRFNDPTGHGSCDGVYLSAMNYCQFAYFNEYFNVSFTGNNWNSRDMAAARIAVIDVGVVMSSTLGGTAADAFNQVYKDGVEFYWGTDNKRLTRECASIGSGGCTTSATLINFASLAQKAENRPETMAFQLAKNNVVHELGHAFANIWVSYDRNGKQNVTPGSPYDVLNRTRTLYLRNGKGYHRPPDPQKYGAIRMWQQSLETSGNETFANMFLGWAYGAWEESDAGGDRMDFMNSYMPAQVNLAAGR